MHGIINASHELINLLLIVVQLYSLPVPYYFSRFSLNSNHAPINKDLE